MEKFGKIMMVVFIGALILFVASPLIFLFLLSGAYHLIGPIAGLAVLILLLFIFSRLEIYKKPNGKKLAAAVIVFCLLAGSSFAIPYYYKESFAKVDDAGVDIYDYAPFTDSQKIARLEEPPAFKIESDVPKLDGATALFPLYAAFAEAVYSDEPWKSEPYNELVVSYTTPEAYSRLVNGEVDMIFAAGPSLGQERAAAAAGVELEMTPIGREAFVFFINSRNKINGLSSEEVRSIYSGKTTNWQELGGKNDTIRAFQRPADSGSQTTFIKFMEDTPIQEPEIEEMASGMGGIISEVASYRNYKNAIGYTFRFYSTEMVRNDKIKLLSIDGVEPTVETIRSGEYPLTSEFYAITAGTENPNVQPFIDWILSEEGQELVEKTGYVSIQ